MGQGKAVHIDQPKSNPTRADLPGKAFTFISLGHVSILPLLDAGAHSYCIVLVGDHNLYTLVYTVKNKSDEFDVLKKFDADTAIIRSKPFFVGFVETRRIFFLQLC